MDRYVLFINTSSDYLMYPLKAFIGARYASATTIDLYFEKAPLAYKVTLTIETGTGAEVASKIGELFSGYTGFIIKFDEIKGFMPFPEISSIDSFSKVIIR